LLIFLLSERGLIRVPSDQKQERDRKNCRSIPERIAVVGLCVACCVSI
jgi:hypothetical protein